MNYRKFIYFLFILLSMFLLSACSETSRWGDQLARSGITFVTPDGKPTILSNFTPNVAVMFDEHYRIKDWNKINWYDIQYAKETKKSHEVYLETEFEQTYDNMELTLEETVIPSDFITIRYTVENHNKKPFFLWSVAFLEYKEDGVWVRYLYPKEPCTPYWMRIGFFVPTNSSDPAPDPDTLYQFQRELVRVPSHYSFDTIVLDDPNFPELTPGEYRLAVYVGKEILYAPLTIVEE